MAFKFLKADFNGDPNIGLYGFATNDYCILGTQQEKKIFNGLRKTLETEIKITTMAGTELIGLFSAGNKNGILVTKIIEDYELKRMKKMFDINIEVIDSKETALGNLILCNDKGCLISLTLKKFKKLIAGTLGCNVEIGRVSKLDIVGSAALANNKGCLCHREASEREMKKIEEVLKVRVDVGTVSYGSTFIKAGLIANDKGVLFSSQTTGPEIGRIEEVLE